MEYVIFKNRQYPIIDFKLDLNGLGINNIKDISNLGDLKTIKILDLHNNDITIISELEKLSSLQALYLQGNKITEISGLDKLENLEELKPSNNKIKVITGLSNLKKLKKLELHQNEIENISGLESLTSLEILNLGNNKINKISGLDSLKNLINLYLHNNDIKIIENISELSNLQIIDLSSNPISEITGFENLNDLMHVKLNETRIQKELFDKLGGYKGVFGNKEELKNLMRYCQGKYIEYNGKFYYLSNNKLKLNNLEIEDISDIKRLNELNFLEYLELRGNKIKDINNLDSLVNLRALYLSQNRIERINTLNSLPKLKTLALNDNQITEITGLDTLQHLDHLNLSNNNISEIKGLKKLKHLKELFLTGNKIISIKNFQMLSNLENLHLADNQISEIHGLDNLRNLKILNLSNNRINSLKGIEDLRNLEVLYLNNNSISKIENLDRYINLRELYLANNEIRTIEGLQSLIKLKHLNLENNRIKSDLFELLRLSDYNPVLFVSYCILKPIIENLKDRIIWLNLINEYPYLKDVNYDQLRNIANRFRCVEIQITDNYEIQKIITPEYLVNELDELLEPFPENKDLSYKFITEKLSLINEEASKKLGKYIIKNRLSKFPSYESEKGISKMEKKLLKHQLAIYDTLNQKYFFKKGLFRSRIKQIENFILSKKEVNYQIYKFAFITDNVIRENNAPVNFLEKDSDWHLIYISKEEKKTDVDTKLLSFVNDLNNLYSKEWDTVYLITLDRDLINSFLTTFKQYPQTQLFFITQPDNDLLKFKLGLKKYEEHDFEINVFYRA